MNDNGFPSADGIVTSYWSFVCLTARPISNPDHNHHVFRGSRAARPVGAIEE